MSEASSTLADIPGLMRIENTGKEELTAHCMELTHAVYPHHQVYGQYCTIHEYVDCPPEQAYDYLRQGHHLEEWTSGQRGGGKVPEDFAWRTNPKQWQEELGTPQPSRRLDD